MNRMLAKSTLYIAVSFVAVLLLTAPCSAEKIFLKDGRTVYAKIISCDGTTLWTEQKYGDSTGKIGIDRREIARIENDDGTISKYDYRTLLGELQEFIKKKEYEEALKRVRSLRDSFPDHDRIKQLFAFLSHKAGYHDEAIEGYMSLVQGGTVDPVIFNNLGALCAELRDYSAAIRWFKKALDEDPGMAESHTNLAHVYLELKQYDDAINEYRTAIRYDSDNVEALFNLGVAYKEKGDIAEARDAWKKVLSVNPDDKDAKKALELLTAHY